MNNLKNGLLMSLILSVALMFGTVFLGAATPPADVLNAAQNGLKIFTALNGDSMDDCVFNVSSREELDHAVVGFGFRMYSVNPKFLRDPGNRLLSRMVEPTPTWRFVVLSKTKPIGLITVNLVNGQWQAVGAGAAELAAEVNMVRKAWPARDGFDFRFVRVYQATADFIEVSHKQNMMGYVPMKAARVSLNMGQMDLQADQLMAESELMEPLRDRAMRNMKDFLKKDVNHEEEE